MSDNIVVDFNQISDLSQRLAEHASQMADILHHLDTQLQALDGQWTGEAHDAFLFSRHQWQQAMLQLQRFVLVTGQAVNNINVAYGEAEKALAQSL